ncbi:uncharacterized protein LY89DRAFT_507796 [Mollisia scopiformis]|uniref:Uncharacterized protein n=1 Tax=Mollisia scopiformis TaxID=149040 RepID=A0A194XFE9_MOLSC|nr:uncharacterized protein LY89DRAFT_507796 [Mollisia scopiformis]KUJ18920.1 hypothetical protein LY89DRAFT_507796 [Mollisia scopiformis]
MVIVSLVAAGVGRAIDAYSDRKARRGERRRSSDSQIDGEIAVVSEDVEQQRRELEAFKELQNYANFQDDLSSKVLDDLSRENASIAYSDQSLPRQDSTSYSPPRPVISRIPSRPKLQWPIIIPQGNTQNGNSCWVRAYPRPLLELGIDQSTFLSFLDSFDVHMKLSTRLEAVNVASTSSGIGWRDVPGSFSRSIPAAVQVMKAHQRERKSNSFLNHVNTLTFRPRGLYAIIITSRSDSPLQVITVEVPPPKPVQYFDTDVEMWTGDDSSKLPEEDSMIATSDTVSSMLSYRQSDGYSAMSLDSAQRKRSLQQVPNAYSPSEEAFEGISDAEQSAPRSPFASLLSSVAKHRERKNEVVTKRLRKDTRPFTRPSIALTNALDNVLNRPISNSHNVTPTWEKMNMEADALYLVIVNDPEEEMPQPAKSMGMYKQPMSTNKQNPSKRNVSRQIKGGMMRQPQSSESSSSNRFVYDPVYDTPSSAPPAYSEKQ